MIGLIEGIVDVGFAWARYLGLPVLFVIFLSKGMLIGKIFPTSLFLPGYVIVTGASVPMALVIAVVTGIAYVVGQLTIYLGCRKYGEAFVTSIPYADIDTESERFETFDSWFSTYGGPSIFVTNFVPWIRGLLTIPAGTSSYRASLYLFHTTTSTILYHTVYVALGLGLLELFR